MCWEDQKKARTLETRPQLVGAGSTVQLQSNPMRTRLILSFDQNAAGQVSVGIQGNPFIALATVNATVPTAVLRIEDYGQALTGSLTVDGSIAAANFGVTETIINEPY